MLRVQNINYIEQEQVETGVEVRVICESTFRLENMHIW